MEQISLQDGIILLIGILTLGKFVVDAIIGLLKPNSKQDISIALLKESVSNIENNLLYIKQNHIDHIEKDVKNNRETLVKIETILDERLPKKNKDNV